MAQRRILVVDDEAGMLEVCADTLSELKGVEVRTEPSSARAAQLLTAERFDLLISDIRMPEVDGLELLRIARRHDPELTVLLFTAFPAVESAVEAMKLGAADYVTKPFVPDDLLATVRRLLDGQRLKEENLLFSRQAESGHRFDDLVGRSHGMRAVFDAIERIAGSDVDVLIVGETGTGKELVARSIHGRSLRKKGRFVPVDCGAIPENLLESEFFGHERGAFTGAVQRSLGLLEFADGGTFFLDEVAELPSALQAKLLRVLQERNFRRVGGNQEIDVDLRVVAATNQDLGGAVKARRFREDLYYRIHVASITVPPLRERAEDIPLLTEHFVARYGREAGDDSVELGEEALDVLCRHPWPGNVRQLQNVIRRTLAMRRHELIVPEDLPDEIVEQAGTGQRETGGFFAAREQRVAAFEKDYLSRLLTDCGGDVTAAVERARLPRGTLYRLLKKHGLSAADFRQRG